MFGDDGVGVNVGFFYWGGDVFENGEFGKIGVVGFGDRGVDLRRWVFGLVGESFFFMVICFDVFISMSFVRGGFGCDSGFDVRVVFVFGKFFYIGEFVDDGGSSSYDGGYEVGLVLSILMVFEVVVVGGGVFFFGW